MAHSCPECGCLCHCGGDIDDIDWGEDCEEADKCTHYLGPDCSYGKDDDSDFDIGEKVSK